jgi:hypothetical protein
MIAGVGFFGTYLFGDGHWSVHKPDDDPPVSTEPWLLVDIYDSDIATVIYRPAGRGTGITYLGYTPRTYFEDPDASAPTDTAAEAAGLASWWAAHHSTVTGGAVSDAALAAKVAELGAFLAADLDPADIAVDEDAEVFVEIKTAAFLAALDLPAIEDLSD